MEEQFGYVNELEKPSSSWWNRGKAIVAGQFLSGNTITQLTYQDIQNNEQIRIFRDNSGLAPMWETAVSDGVYETAPRSSLGSLRRIIQVPITL